MRSYRGLIVIIAAVVVVAAGGAVVLFATGEFGSDREAEAQETLDAFLAGWPTGELDGVPFVDPAGAAVPSAEVADAITGLSGELAELPPALSTGELTLTDDIAATEISVDWPLPGGSTWTYASPVRLSERDGDWRVIWQPAVVHPELIEDDELQLRRLASTRGDILGGDGDPLVTERDVVVIGVEPQRVTDVDQLAADLDSALQSLGHDLELADTLPDRVEEADPEHFVQVVTLRRTEYDQIRDQVRPLDGTVFREEQRHLAPTRIFARALLGTVDPVTAEDIENNPGLFEAGDYTGHGGLAEQYEEQLRGTIGQAVVVARTAADGVVDDIEVERIEPVDGADLTTTLDADAQDAAEQALGDESKPAALVAIRVSDGEVLAVANTEGTEANPVNVALTGSVPPGSTFKMVSGYALLDSGEVALDTPVACPETLTVEGFDIGNAFDGDRGDIPFREAMAISCNTAFAGLAPQLGNDGLATAGATLGIGGDWQLGVESFTGSVPTGGSELDRAAAAFGQGGTQVSPVAMAAATATVARGAWLPPSLVAGPEAAAQQPEPLPEATVTDLHAAMREVVTSGTGSALGDVPGGDVYGKTGTAEAGEDNEIEHAWFVGWQDDVAVAVFVEDGGSGSGTAAPLAEAFLRALSG
jgi:cell division protein FtsI/penicillin-binding protein 2